MSGIILKEPPTDQNMIYQKKEKIIRSGRSAHLTLRPPLKEYCWIDDEVDVVTFREGNQIIIQIKKKFLDFNFKEIEQICKENKLKISEQRKIGDTKIYQAINKNTVLSCTENLLNDGLINVTISNTILNVGFDEYIKQKSRDNGKKVIVQPEGDVDTINILGNPSNYEMTLKEAFSFLKKDGKKIGVSVLYRFDNRHDTIQKIEKKLKNII